MPHWSPDGKQIAFNGTGVDGKSRIYLVGSDGAGLSVVTSGQGGSSGDADPSWSPDGQSIAFGGESFHTGPSSHFCLLNIKSHRISILTGSEGMSLPAWSADGKFLSGTSVGSPGLWLYNFSTRKKKLLYSGMAHYSSWSVGSEYLYFNTLPVDSNYSIWRLRLSDQRLEQVLDMTKQRVGIGFGWFTFTPGGQILTARSLGTKEIYRLTWKEN
jgi:Tol biopolymer transport system component